MPKRKYINVETRTLIIAQHNLGISNRQIARKLRLNPSSVDYNLKEYSESGSFLNEVRSGRPRATTPAQDIAHVVSNKRNRRKTALEIAAEINIVLPKPINVSRVKRRLQKAGLHGRIAIRKPLLRQVNKKRRLQWVREHRN